jgi:hypothetical protein
VSLLVYRNKFHGLGLIQVWWPETAQEVRHLLDQAPLVMLWQCPTALLPDLRPWVFHLQPFRTSLIDLTRAEEQLWQNLEAKSCRYEIRKAQKLNCEISCNEDTDAARSLIDDSIRRLGYRGGLGADEWKSMLPFNDVFLCKWQGSPVAAHVLRRDHPGHVRLLMSGGADRSDERFRSIVGPCNRLLHWHEFQHYKAEGYRVYDFGGCELDKAAPGYPISQFKLSFGGEVVEEPMVYLARTPALRAVLRARSTLQGAVRKVPWPDALLKAVRARPKLASLFR